MLQRFKESLIKFMYGRNGSDNLGRLCMWGGLAVLIIASLTRLGILTYIAFAMYFYSLFRIFSRNVEKRRLENQKYLQATANMRLSMTQRINRLKNAKQYKYFRCPECRSYLKLPRGVGEVTVTCGKCRKQFRKKA